MNKKIVILVVVVECILAILLIGVIGLAIESIIGEVQAQEIYFTVGGEETTLKPSETGKGWTTAGNGQYILTPGSIYREKEKVLEWLPTPDHSDDVEPDQDIMIEVARPERGYQLQYVISPSNTSEQTVTFTSNKPDQVTVDESGYVTFFEDVDVSITVSTKNGRTATVILFPKRNMNADVEIE